MIKQFLKGAFTALTLGIILSLNTAAAEAGDSIEIDDSGNVTLMSDHAAEDGITALQFSLEVETDADADVYFEFNPENSVKISDYRYHAESNSLNIYMVGSEQLFDDMGLLNIGAVSAADKDGNIVDVNVSAMEDSLKYVYQNTLTDVSLNAETTASGTEPTATTATTVSTTAVTTKPNAATTASAAATTAKPTATATASAAESTAKPTTTTKATATETAVSHIASDEEIRNWAIEDYKDRTGVTAAKAEINENSEGQYEITLTDEAGNVLDTYVIDPVTGIGTNSANEEVNLPQTGNNSPATILIVIGGVIITVIGFCVVRSSGVIRRKKDEK